MHSVCVGSNQLSRLTRKTYEPLFFRVYFSACYEDNELVVHEVAKGANLKSRDVMDSSKGEKAGHANWQAGEQKEKERDRERQTDRQRHTNRDRQTETDTHTDRGLVHTMPDKFENATLRAKTEQMFCVHTRAL